MILISDLLCTPTSSVINNWRQDTEPQTAQSFLDIPLFYYQQIKSSSVPAVDRHIQLWHLCALLPHSYTFKFLGSDVFVSWQNLPLCQHDQAFRDSIRNKSNINQSKYVPPTCGSVSSVSAAAVKVNTTALSDSSKNKSVLDSG